MWSAFIPHQHTGFKYLFNDSLPMIQCTVLIILHFHNFYNTLVYNEIMHRNVLFCGMKTVTCVVGTVCKVHRVEQSKQGESVNVCCAC